MILLSFVHSIHLKLPLLLLGSVHEILSPPKFHSAIFHSSFKTLLKYHFLCEACLTILSSNSVEAFPISYSTFPIALELAVSILLSKQTTSRAKQGTHFTEHFVFSVPNIVPDKSRYLISVYREKEMNGCRQRYYSLNAILWRDFTTRVVCPYFGRPRESLTVHAELPFRRFQLAVIWRGKWSEERHKAGRALQYFSGKVTDGPNLGWWWGDWEGEDRNIHSTLQRPTDGNGSQTEGRKEKMRNQIQHWDSEYGWQRGPVTDMGSLVWSKQLEIRARRLERMSQLRCKVERDHFRGDCWNEIRKNLKKKQKNFKDKT